MWAARKKVSTKCIMEEPVVHEGESRGYVDAIDHYFKIKDAYLTKVKDAKRKIYEKEENKKTAKKKILGFVAPCIHCKRPVGTIFTTTKTKYGAICGDKQNPCILNIDIYRGFVTSIQEIVDIYRNDLDYLKDSIIQQKLDTLFNYIGETQTVELFKKGLNAYNGDSIIYKEVLDVYNSLYEDPVKRDRIEQKKGEIYALIDKSRGFLLEFRKTREREFLKLAVETNVKEILPEIENLRMLKNEVIEMRTNIDGKGNVVDYSLFTYPILLSKIDYNSGEPQRVVKYVT